MDIPNGKEAYTEQEKEEKEGKIKEKGNMMRTFEEKNCDLPAGSGPLHGQINPVYIMRHLKILNDRMNKRRRDFAQLYPSEDAWKSSHTTFSSV